MGSRSEARDALERLLADSPDLHGAGAAANWQLDGPLLEWLTGEARLGGRSLETGCGYSTIVLGQLSAEHVAVSPVAVEHARIEAWCRREGVSLEHVRFVEAESERYLPAIDAAEESLDLVLIDGDHAYPVPALDWYHSAPLLAMDGLLVVDDVHIPACGELAAFLRADRANWRERHRVAEAVVFQKVGRRVHASGDWRSQPWNRSRPSAETRLRRARAGLDARRRLRSVLRRP